MPIVTVQMSSLTCEDKQKIGHGIVSAFKAQGIDVPVLVLFREEEPTFFVGAGPEPVEAAPPPPAPPAEVPEPAAPRARRGKDDFEADKRRLVAAFLERGILSSFDAQGALGLRNEEHASATLRRLFAELEAEGLLRKFGQKRGTKYEWIGPRPEATPLPPPPPPSPLPPPPAGPGVKLIKKVQEVPLEVPQEVPQEGDDQA